MRAYLSRSCLVIGVMDPFATVGEATPTTTARGKDCEMLHHAGVALLMFGKEHVLSLSFLSLPRRLRVRALLSSSAAI